MNLIPKYIRIENYKNIQNIDVQYHTNIVFIGVPILPINKLIIDFDSRVEMSSKFRERVKDVIIIGNGKLIIDNTDTDMIN